MEIIVENSMYFMKAFYFFQAPDVLKLLCQILSIFRMLNMETKKAEACNGSEIKPRRRRLRVGDPDFVPPDGGWGWMIVVACGFSNVSP